MNHLARQSGMSGLVECDSAGTLDYHAGNPPDARMRRAAAERGLTLTGRARPFQYRDFQDFDLILAMDQANLGELHAMDQHARYRDKTSLFCTFCTSPGAPREVPDPYYGGDAGFAAVLDLLEDGCQGILNHLRARVEV